jgi:hypothetical protein
MIQLEASRCTIGDNELPMTLQVGMLGTNGVLIAGDMRLSRKAQPGINAPWQFYDGPKILISPSGRIAVAVAHCMQTGKDIADAIFARMTHGDHPACEREIRDAALSVIRGRNVECLIAFQIRYQVSMCSDMGSVNPTTLSSHKGPGVARPLETRATPRFFGE